MLPFLVLFFSIKWIIDYNTSEDFDYKWNYSVENTSQKIAQKFSNDGRFRGMNVYRLGRRKIDKTLDNLIKNNVEWISVIPYLYQKDEKSIEISPSTAKNEWSKRDSIFIKNIVKTRKKGFSILLKPHIWMSDGWRSNINFDDDKNWNIWFDEYQRIQIHYAHLAEKTNSELFCIGTELRSSLDKRPKRWLSLIKKIKSIYKGKLTYAANWDDSFEFTEFWNELDYIGIQAYYPLTKVKNPDLETIKNGWQPHLLKLEKLSKKYNKQILFTEVGYRNDLYATIEPWSWGSFFQRLYRKKSNKVQLLAYQALYEELWNKEWFAGTFPWEWNSSDFPVQGTPSENMIAIWYSK
ncbi:glycoside hydrolase family 113 [Polaribacter porphyrae]|nr:hypothetical protein [Polaribacter porphyrae]